MNEPELTTVVFGAVRAELPKDWRLCVITVDAKGKFWQISDLESKQLVISLLQRVLNELDPPF